MQRAFDLRDAQMRAMQQHLSHLDPSQVFERGYSVVRDERGSVVMDGEKLALGARLDITFARGRASAEVKEK
jgi:exonuclease VII large subunit